ncbi:MAG: O-antigen ligase family protein [Crocinitomicaceae bacterium]|nr:O-antigen ligase family protein [Crocinitomicaceae bacterium]
MGGEIKKPYVVQLNQLLLSLSLVGAILLPPIRIGDGFPALEVSDIAFPILVLSILFFFRSDFLQRIKKHRQIIFVFLVFIAFTVVSILGNGRWGELRDWFEVLKYIKFIAFIGFIYFFFNQHQYFRVIVPLFILAFIFNLLHYFNIFGFNSIIEPFYAAPHHLDFFGLNSLGEPATKRALGVLGNPNTNGLFFLSFILLFLPKSTSYPSRNTLLLGLAITGLLLCQTRTGILTYIIVLIVFYISNPSNWRKILQILLFSILIYFGLSLLGNLYLNSLANPGILKNAGIGRVEPWQKIIDAMPGHWIIGHAPEKEYFERHTIYSESEYFLILFRYGLLGIMAFLLFWAVWLKNYALKTFRRNPLAILVAFVYLTGAITNNPLQSPKIALILGTVMAVSLFESDDQTN